MRAPAPVLGQVARPRRRTLALTAPGNPRRISASGRAPTTDGTARGTGSSSTEICDPIRCYEMQGRKGKGRRPRLARAPCVVAQWATSFAASDSQRRWRDGDALRCASSYRPCRLALSPLPPAWRPGAGGNTAHPLLLLKRSTLLMRLISWPVLSFQSGFLDPPRARGPQHAGLHHERDRSVPPRALKPRRAVSARAAYTCFRTSAPFRLPL